MSKEVNYDKEKQDLIKKGWKEEQIEIYERLSKKKEIDISDYDPVDFDIDKMEVVERYAEKDMDLTEIDNLHLRSAKEIDMLGKARELGLGDKLDDLSAKDEKEKEWKTELMIYLKEKGVDIEKLSKDEIDNYSNQTLKIIEDYRNEVADEIDKSIRENREDRKEFNEFEHNLPDDYVLASNKAIEMVIAGEYSFKDMNPMEIIAENEKSFEGEIIENPITENVNNKSLEDFEEEVDEDIELNKVKSIEKQDNSVENDIDNMVNNSVNDVVDGYEKEVAQEKQDPELNNEDDGFEM